MCSSRAARSDSEGLKDISPYRAHALGQVLSLLATQPRKNYFAYFVGLLLHHLTELLSLFGDEYAIRSPIDWIGMPLDKSGRFQPVDHSTERGFAGLELRSEIALSGPISTAKLRKYHPLGAGYTERPNIVVEQGTPKSGNVMN